MIELYRPIECPTCEKIEYELKDMVLAHKVITVSGETFPVELPPNTHLPALKDNGDIITGQAEIEERLKQLRKIAFEWRKYQYDSCYIHDDDGGFC